MYTILATNIEGLKEKGIAAKDGEISIAVMEIDIEKENPTFYAFRQGMIYNPQDGFKPNITGNHKLPEKLIEEYDSLVPEARKQLKKLQAHQGNKKGNSGETDELKQAIELLDHKQTRIDSMAEQMQLMNEKLNALKDANAELNAKLEETKKGEKVRHEKFQTILTLVERKRAVYLYGAAGTGKSQLAEDIAKALKLNFYPASTITQEFKLTGYQDANGIYRETNFYRAMKYGGLFFLDEMDSCMSDVLVGINGALANGYFDFPHETVTAHPDFRVIAAGNTIGRGGNMAYTGRQALDISTLDRFLAVEIKYSPAIDKAVANGDMELVEFAHAVRKAAEENEIMILLSYRSLSTITELKELFDLVEVLQMAFIKGMASDDIRMLTRNMSIPFENKYFAALKEAA